MILWPSYDNFRLTAEANGAVVHYSELGKGFSFVQEIFAMDIDSSILFRAKTIYLTYQVFETPRTSRRLRRQR